LPLRATTSMLVERTRGRKIKKKESSLATPWKTCHWLVLRAARHVHKCVGMAGYSWATTFIPPLQGPLPLDLKIRRSTRSSGEQEKK
jgi:hypothetical protein